MSPSRKTSTKIAWLWAALCVLVLARAADAQIFVHKDEFGRVYFTDTPLGDGYEQYHSKSERRARAQPSPETIRGYEAAIRRASRQHGVSPALVKAVIAAESGFDRTAISRRGARGLMQLMPETALALGVDDLLDPWQNIDGGTRYLGEMIERFPGGLDLALAAYNAGPEAVKQYQGVPPYTETKAYVRRVLRLYKKFHADFR
jgi:soluble lytic murein transglycosylase-like protein